MFRRMQMALHGAIDGWNGLNAASRDMNSIQRDYELKWALYNGAAFNDVIHKNPYRNDRQVYKNTRLLWKHVESIVEFYKNNVYRGALAAEPPEEGDRLGGAIPFIAQAGEKNDALLKVIVETFIAWNWQQQMSLRPMYGAAVGDVLTELIEDKGFVYPQTVWAGHVVEVELDWVNNVQSYVTEQRRTITNDRGEKETFLFRKEVDKEEFRYFKDDKPYNAYGDGAVVENPYGFVPAIWDMHREGKPGEVRGRSAIDGTISTLMEVNSIFSHAFDFQRKTFFAPVMIAAKNERRRGPQEVDVTPGEEPRDQAETMSVIPVPEGAQLLQPQFDIGKTREMLQDVQEGILDENPEARFYQQLRGMATVATETAKILTEDAGARLASASDRYDSNTVKLFQMHIAMCGLRANDRTWTQDGRRLTERQMAFVPFDLESYSRGELDMSIAKRELIEETDTEKLARVERTERLRTAWAHEQMGNDEETARKILDEIAASNWRMVNGGSYADLMLSGE